jgi:2Fe-2S ferredoxin
MYTIEFYKHGSEAEPVVLTGIEPGQSLLEVAIDYSIGLRHDCGGMSSCGTCHIFLMSGSEFVEFRSKRESHQLSRTNDVNGFSRLACQCVLLPGQGSLRVELPPGYFFAST